MRLPAFLRLLAACLAMAELIVIDATADTPASSVYSHIVTHGESYPKVPVQSEGWFDLGGYCKVVDVGDLSGLDPLAQGVPVFVPGPPGQWENYRHNATSHYGGRLALTTCCRPQSAIAMLCTEAGATPIAINREYGKLGETDTVSATCLDQWGKTYTDSAPVTCTGDNGPDGQGLWVQGGPDTPGSCTPNAYTSPCSATCPTTTGTTTTYDSCGNVQSGGVQSCSITCCTVHYSCGACDQDSGVKTCTDTGCGTGDIERACTLVSKIGSCSTHCTCHQYSCSNEPLFDCGVCDTDPVTGEQSEGIGPGWTPVSCSGPGSCDPSGNNTAFCGFDGTLPKAASCSYQYQIYQ